MKVTKIMIKEIALMLFVTRKKAGILLLKVQIQCDKYTMYRPLFKSDEKKTMSDN